MQPDRNTTNYNVSNPVIPAEHTTISTFDFGPTANSIHRSFAGAIEGLEPTRYISDSSTRRKRDSKVHKRDTIKGKSTTRRKEVENLSWLEQLQQAANSVEPETQSTSPLKGLLPKEDTMAKEHEELDSFSILEEQNTVGDEWAVRESERLKLSKSEDRRRNMVPFRYR